MAIGSTWQPLTATAVDALPDAPAVFELGSLVRSVLFIGGDASEGLRAAVLRALADPRLRLQARCLRWELSGDPRTHAAQLLAGYRATHDGAVPAAQPRSASTVRTLPAPPAEPRPSVRGATPAAPAPATFLRVRTVA
jgi:hypothetical protein